MFYFIILVFWGFISAAKADPLAVARAWIDWDSLEIYTDDGVSISWNEYEYRILSATANENNDYWENYYYYYDWNWNNYWYVSVTQGGASASATIDSYILDDYYALHVSAESQGVGENMAYASASRERTFTVSGNGWVSFIVPYHFEVTVNLYGGGYASAYSEAYFSVGNTNCELWENCSSFDHNELYSNGAGFWTDDYYLEISFYFNDGDTGYLKAEVYSDASSSSPVPLPSALWLFGSGLFGVAGFRKFLGPGRKHS